MSAKVLIARPFDAKIDWLKLNPLRLNAIVEIPSAVSQIQITGNAAKKKCRDRELLKDPYWNNNRPK